MKQVLSPKELARAIGVSESSLKRWADDGLIRATRTGGGHRRIPIAEAIRFLRETEATLVHPEILGLPDVEAVAGAMPAREDEAERLHTYIEGGHAREARGLILSMYLEGRSVAEICDGPIRLAMHRIGDLWRHGPEGIFIEHRATDICAQAINQLRSTLQPVPGTFGEGNRAAASRDSVPIVPDTEAGEHAAPDTEERTPVATGGAPAGDPYMLPSLMAAASLEGEGFRAINLGPDSPPEALLLAARHHRADLVWLSASAEDLRAADLSGQIDALLAGLSEIGLSLIIGGNALQRVQPPASSSLHIGQSMAELVAFAKGIALAAKGSPPSAPPGEGHPPSANGQ
ncbi:MAG: excisionase family DNA-binding protein [Planctomycetota bacterium]|nr:excisionase family DNA-binding protein [Planctomycetota bacterium]